MVLSLANSNLIIIIIIIIILYFIIKSTFHSKFLFPLVSDSE